MAYGFRASRLVAIAAIAFALPLSSVAQAQTNPQGATSHRVPMRPSALTLGSHRGRPAHQGVGRLGNARGRQLHTTPIHGTMAGPRS